MALSSSKYTSFGTNNGYRLQIEWSATQSISGNTSTVAAKLYLISTGSSYTINAYATKSGSITIDGTTTSFNFSASLSGNQKKEIGSASKTITHGSDGTKSFNLSATAGIEVTLGSYISSVSIGSTSYTLDTIPRASTLSSSASWTAGNTLAINITRASSSFTHDVAIRVNGTTIKTVTGIGTSTTVTFTNTENENIFKQLAQTASKSTEIVVTTKNSGTTIGTSNKTGTCTAPTATTAVISNPANESITTGQEASTVFVDQSITINLTRQNSAFTHTLAFYSNGTLVKTITGVGTSTTWTPSASEMTAILNTMPSSIEVDGDIQITTFYGSTQVRSAVSKDINFRIRGSNPTFSAFTYKDTNSTTTTLTGNPTLIIQNASTLSVEITTANRAVAKDGATMSSYTATINGVSVTTAYSSSATVTILLGKVNVDKNTTLTVKAQDSRGNSTSVSYTVTVIPWKLPVLNLKVARLNNYEDSTTLSITGTASPLLVNSVVKNSLPTLTYQYKQSTTSTYGSAVNITPKTIASSGVLTIGNSTLTLNKNYSWDVKVNVSDAIGSTSYTIKVGSGMPFLMPDATLDSIGIFAIPSTPNTLEIGVNTNISGNITAANFSDSGWITLTLLNGFTNYGGNANDQPRVRKIGKIVSIRGRLSPPSTNTVGTNDGMACVQLPTGFIPPRSIICVQQGSVRAIWALQVQTDGSVMISRYRAEDSTYVNPDNTVMLPFEITYMVD